MEDYIEPLLLYIRPCAGLYLFGWLAKCNCVERKYGPIKYWLTIFYNILACALHLFFFLISGEKSTFLYVGWLALLMVLLHIHLTIVVIRSKSWSILNHFDPRM
ncbi:hypothetical protein RRX38_22315 [Pseudomonas sp. DTU_2021_1001937_2_SI_NGA_ILE_001]|uniref:hypothetical protein n=1 Tax=Pseudomonas sp. DTU_2021_1001937_2_SI_NGA_ILE_001 TaxID=3077589 RepID=UPI0028FC0F7F|nr:hypothetical protein [Pseudomonas sp. DTU_2021_1001937_2_SI_NGA_ILE_001]WNW13777.1 hypothetical protein RRX38_22315 [Pseudomonas sp. DTU_2021_1001937_2_SI_NGA_ILE_001]